MKQRSISGTKERRRSTEVLSASALKPAPALHPSSAFSRARPLRPVGAVSVALIGFALLSGCRVSSEEIRGWARKASGPRKLVAVVQHEKYGPALRVDAAMTLV